MSNNAIILEAAWKLAETILKDFPHAPRDLPSFISRLVELPPPADPKASASSLLQNEGQYLTIKATAARLGLCKKTVEKMVLDGRLRALRFGPKITRIPESEILRHMESASKAGGLNHD